MTDFEWLKGACALVRTGHERGTAYLIHSEWAVTCAHVVRDATTVTLEFSWGEAKGDVSAERDERADVALIKLTQPLSTVTPLRLSTLYPDADAQCRISGFPGEASAAQLTFPAVVRDPLAKDDQGRPGISIYSDEAAAGDGAKLSGFSGSPVVIGRAVVGHLRRVLGEHGKAIFGLMYASPASSVLRGLPEALAKELAVVDAEAMRKKMKSAVIELLAECKEACEQLASETTTKAMPEDLADHLFRLDPAKLLNLCDATHDKLLLKDPPKRAAADCVWQVSLATLPVLYEIGSIRIQTLGAGTLLQVEAVDRMGVDMLIARHDGRPALLARDDKGRLRGKPEREATYKIEEGKADIEVALGQVRTDLAGALGIDTEGLAIGMVDRLINDQLAVQAEREQNARDRRFRHYYLFVESPATQELIEPASLAFAQRLAETYQELHVVRLRRTVPEGAGRIHATIDQALKAMLQRRS